MTPLAEAVVDLGAIAHNTEVFARSLGSARMLAVVKANGFGHGAVEVARTALDHGASWLGVTSSVEALALREQGITAPLLMWLYRPGENLVPALRAGVQVSVGSGLTLDTVAEQAIRAGLVAPVHLKVDTGFSRAGAPAEEWAQVVKWARKHENSGSIKVHGLWSHLATAEHRDDPRLAAQQAAFQQAIAVARAAGLQAPLHHLANSAAALQLPQTRFDLGRVGIGLYGVEPVPGRTFGLRAAMTVQTSVVLCKRVPAGTEVSYGHDWRAPRATTLALVPMGFADGIPRHAGSRASVWIRGVRCPIAGRVTMDQCVIDVGDLPVAAGDPVVVFGPGDAGEPTVGDWAGWADTNPHEILTGISLRVPRRYLPLRPPRSLRPSIPHRPEKS